MDSLYTRYASALLSLAIEDNMVDFYRSEVKELKKAFISEDGIIKLLSSSFIEFNEKEKVVDDIYEGNDNIKNFIKVIVRNNRSNYLVKIFDTFIKSCNEVLNIEDGIVYSVRNLSNDEIERIEEAISNKMNTKVELENIVDERLIGGVKVIVNDKIFDGSIKNKVERLHESLIRGGAN